MSLGIAGRKAMVRASSGGPGTACPCPASVHGGCVNGRTMPIDGGAYSSAV